MYNKDGPFGAGAKMRAMNRLQYITNKYPTTNIFWKYMEKIWWHKTHMRVVGFQNLPYVGHDTNAAIESYRGTLKAQLKWGKSRLVGHRVDWCIHELVRDVLVQYWYQTLCKNFGFMNNKHQQFFVVGALLGSMVDSWNKCDIAFLWWWSSTCQSCHKKNPFAIHHPQTKIRMGML